MIKEIVKELEDNDIEVIGYNEKDNIHDNEIILDNDYFIIIDKGHMTLYKENYKTDKPKKIIKTNNIKTIIDKL